MMRIRNTDPIAAAMTDPIEARLAAALAFVAHERRWCKSSDLWHAIAHAEDEEDTRVRTEAAHAILATDPTLICPDPADHSLRDPFSVWQGVCGHLWRKVDDGEECPYCVDLALAAAVRGLEDITEMSYDPSLRRGQWDVRINDHVGVGDTLTEAIKAAKEAERE